MNWFARHLLIAALLVFAQRAAALHEIDHALHEPDHSAAQCVAYLAAGSAACNSVPAVIFDAAPLPVPSAAHSFYLPVTRIVFDSRAPPFFA